jgi:hypothetical protein
MTPFGRTPAQTGDGTIPKECHIFEMLADNLAVTEIMVLINESEIIGSCPPLK